MPEYRRAFVPGGTFFFTVVTYERRRIFDDGRAVDLLRKAFRASKLASSFKVDAIVVLPDHLHTIWTLPPGDADFSSRWRYLRRLFSQSYAAIFGDVRRIETRADGRWKIWQPRFWERLVRDVEEFRALADYIHYNPVKHGLAASPAAWKASSFHRWVERGEYPLAWGADDELTKRRLVKAEKIAGEPAS